MQIFKYLYLLIICFANLSIVAAPNEFYLRTGLAFQTTVFNELSDDQFENKYNIDDREESRAYGIYTQFSYRFDKVEIGLESHTTFGYARNFSFGYQNTVLTGAGGFRSFDVTPTIRFNTPEYQFEYLNYIGFKKFKAYVKFGPSWLLNSLNLEKFNINTNGKDLKLNYDSFGAALAIGVEQSKATNRFPFFLEVSVAAYRSYKATLIDRTDKTKTEILLESSARDDIKSYSIFYKIGVTLF